MAKLFIIPFFSFHYGVFAAGHGAFAFAVFGPHEAGARFWPTADGVHSIIVTPAELMVRPYQRVFVLHLVIILGAIGTMAIGSPVAALTVLVAIKTAVDVAAHSRLLRPGHLPRPAAFLRAGAANPPRIA